MSNIYEEAVADAKRLREKAREEARRQILEQFAPKVDRYIEEVLLEAADDDDDDDKSILTDIELPDDASAAAAEKVDDVEASITDEASGEAKAGEAGGISMNPDGTWTLELDDVVVPEEEGVEEKSDDEDTVPDAAPPTKEMEALADGDKKDVKESLDKLRALMQIAEELEDKSSAYNGLAEAFDKVYRQLTVGNHQLTTAQVAGLTTLASLVNEAFMIIRSDEEMQKSLREGLCGKLEGTYGSVNEALAEAVCSRIDRQVTKCARDVKALRKLNETSRRKKGKVLYNKIEGLGRVLEAVIDRTSPAEAGRITTRIATLMKEINHMTRRNRKLQEMEDVVLKLTFDDDEAAEELKSELGGEDGSDLEGGDEDLDALLGDEGGEDKGDDDDAELDLEGDYKMESRVAQRLSRLFESDDEDEGDDDGGDDDGGGDDDMDMDDMDMDMDDDGDDAPESDAVAAVVAALESGDVDIELVDDAEDMDMEDLGGDMDMDLGDDFGEDEDEVVDIDMEDVAEAVRAAMRGTLREMDTNYHKHDQPGPGAGLDDFADASEEGEAFVDMDDSYVVTESRDRRRERLARRRRSQQLAEARGRAKAPSAREVGRLKRQLAESKQKHADSNLLAAKLLYTNRILTMEGLTRSQKERVTDAIDQARNLREAQLLYRNLSKSLQRKARRLSEGRHRPIGSSSQVSMPGGVSRQRRDKAGTVQFGESPMLNESVDLDLWKRHAGLD